MAVLYANEMDVVIRRFVEEMGSQAKAAKELGVSRPYLNDIIHGRRAVGPKVARHFGYRPATYFVRIEEGEGYCI